MKKILAMLLAVALSAGMLAGCGGTKETGKTADGKIFLSIGNWPDPDSNPDSYKTEMEKKEAFEAKYPDIHVEPDYWAYDVQTFAAKAEGETLPIVYNTFATEVKKILELGYSADVTEVMKQYDYYDMISDEIMSQISRDGKVYMIPSSLYSLGLVMNMNLFREAGLVNADGTPMFPETFDDVRSMAKTITEKTGKAGFIFPTTGNGGGWNFTPLAWNFGGTFMEETDEGWKTTFASEEVASALKWLRDMKWEDNSLPATTLVSNDDTSKLIGTDQAAMSFAHPGQVDLLISQYGMDFNDIAYAKMPAGPERHVTLVGGGYICIAPNATPEQIDAAFKWLEFNGSMPKIELPEEIKQSIYKDFETKANEKRGVIGIHDISFWSEEEATRKYKLELTEQFRNIDPVLVASYNDKTEVELQAEEPQKAQDLYAVLDSCLQEVLTNKDADCMQVLEKAAADFQNNHLNNVK
ncbi:MAG: extracellular solute-binding protein [Ruminococcaceae bacterium]|nr:extracellular solute-binding protein [Oscillospiraceae bacterium]